MKHILFVFAISFVFKPSFAQIDSAWMARYTNKFSTDIGKALPDIHLTDTSGRQVSLKKFLGKTLYINVWSTTCAPCYAIYPNEVKLMEDVSKMGLSDSIVFINICTAYTSDKDQWLSVVRSRKDNSVNLYSPDSTIFNAWNMQVIWPTYVLVDKQGRNLGKKVPRPDDASAHFMLYMAAKGTPAYDAVWLSFRNDQLLKKGARNINTDYLQYLEKYKQTYAPYFFWKIRKPAKDSLDKRSI